MTKRQAARLVKKRKVRRSRVRLLSGGPQRKVIIIRRTEWEPRKPNSAKRRVGFVRILTTYKHLYAKMPGEGDLGLKDHMLSLLEGGGLKDSPGINYSLIRGTLGFNMLEKEIRTKGRSKFGTPIYFGFRPKSPDLVAQEEFERRVKTKEYWEKFKGDLMRIFPYYDDKNRHRPWD